MRAGLCLSAALALTMVSYGAAVAGSYSCGGAPSASSTCPDGSIAVYTGGSIRPNQNASGRVYRRGPITPYSQAYDNSSITPYRSRTIAPYNSTPVARYDSNPVAGYTAHGIAGYNARGLRGYNARGLRGYSGRGAYARGGGTIAPYQSSDIPVYHATEAHLLTPQEMAAMDERTAQEARRIARIWTRNARLNPAQVDAINRGTCVIIPSLNPELKCVQGGY